MKCKVCQTPLSGRNRTGLCQQHVFADPEIQRRRLVGIKQAWLRPEGEGRPGRPIPSAVPASDVDDYRRMTQRQGYTSKEAIAVLTGVQA